MGRKPINVKQPATRDRKKGLSLEGLADIEEAAEQLGVSTKTIRRYIQSDRIEAHKVRNIWFIPTEEIARLLTVREQEESNVSPILDELTSLIKGVAFRIERLEAKVTESHPRGATTSQTQKEELDASARKTSQLEEESRILRDEIVDLKEELSRIRIETSAPQIDPQAFKNRAEEIDSLKAIIVSNERGLTLLRDEVREKDVIIKEKEHEILQLLEKLRDIESLRKQPGAPDQKKAGLFGAFIKGVTPTPGRS